MKSHISWRACVARFAVHYVEYDGQLDEKSHRRFAVHTPFLDEMYGNNMTRKANKNCEHICIFQRIMDIVFPSMIVEQSFKTSLACFLAVYCVRAVCHFWIGESTKKHGERWRKNMKTTYTFAIILILMWMDNTITDNVKYKVLPQFHCVQAGGACRSEGA